MADRVNQPTSRQKTHCTNACTDHLSTGEPCPPPHPRTHARWTSARGPGGSACGTPAWRGTRPALSAPRAGLFGVGGGWIGGSVTPLPRWSADRRCSGGGGIHQHHTSISHTYVPVVMRRRSRPAGAAFALEGMTNAEQQQASRAAAASSSAVRSVAIVLGARGSLSVYMYRWNKASGEVRCDAGGGRSSSFRRPQSAQGRSGMVFGE